MSFLVDLHRLFAGPSVRRFCLVCSAGVLLAGCAPSGDAAPPEAPAVVPVTSSPVTSGTPAIPPAYRNPIQERANALNAEDPVANEGRFPELERLRSEYLIPESPETARSNVRAAARAFGAAVLHSVRFPSPSGLNMYLPNHPHPVTLPAGLNSLGRAALHGRDAVSGVDVGPSVPDEEGRVWVALFMGASGPIGAVESYCVGVTLRSDGSLVEVVLEEVASSVVRQPRDRSDFVEVSCVVDLEAPPDEGFAPRL